MTKASQVMFASSMMFYISWMNVGDINSSIFFYTMLFMSFLLLNIGEISIKLQNINLFKVFHVVYWGILMIDQLRWVNGDLIEYLKHYDRDIIKCFLIVYIMVNLILWIFKPLKTGTKKA